MNLSRGTSAEGGWWAQQALGSLGWGGINSSRDDAHGEERGRADERSHHLASQHQASRIWRLVACGSGDTELVRGGSFPFQHQAAFPSYLPFPPSPGAARAVGSDQLLRRLVISLKDTWKSSAAPQKLAKMGKVPGVGTSLLVVSLAICNPFCFKSFPGCWPSYVQSSISQLAPFRGTPRVLKINNAFSSCQYLQKIFRRAVLNGNPSLHIY